MKLSKLSLLSSLSFILLSQNLQAGTSCIPDINTSFSEFQNMAFRISNDNLGNNSLFSQCTDLSNELLLANLNNCAPAPINPINGLGLNPTNKLLYGLSPPDAFGIGTHLEVVLPFSSPGQPGDIMKADNMDVYVIGNDGGFQKAGFIQPPTETAGLPANTHQVVPIVQSAASFNAAGDMFVLAYRTNYTSSADVPNSTAEVLYQAPEIVIGEITSNSLTTANGGNIPVTWNNIALDSSCDAVVDKFKDDTNVFSSCVVSEYLDHGDENTAVQTCLTNTPILDKGIHDFAVSPLNGHFYGYDSMTFDDKDVLIDMNPMTNTASCLDVTDPGNLTGVLSSVMFSNQNKLVTIFANQTSGSWIDVSTGIKTNLLPTVTSAPFSDGSSLPFAGFKRQYFKRGTSLTDLIFKNGFEDHIFANGFEGLGFSSIDLEKSGSFNDANNDLLAQAGETIEYTFNVINDGTFELNTISINDPLVTVTGSLATLEASSNDDSTFSASYALTQTDIDTGYVSNIAAANAFDPSNNPLSVLSNDGVAFIVSLPTTASINLEKIAMFIDGNNDMIAQAGESILYSFIVTNTGNLSLSNISISDPLVNVPGSIPNLAPADIDNSTLSASYTLTQTDIDAGFVSNLATVNASDPTNNPVSDTSNNGVALVTPLQTSSSMALLKTGSFIDTNMNGSAESGETINYSFTVTNTGSTTLSNLTISDPILTVAANLATLAPGASDNLTFSGVYTLDQTDVNNGSVSNLATVNAIDPANNAVMAQSNDGVPLITDYVSTASVSLVKTGVFDDNNNDGLAQVGETISYSFAVKNTGSLTLNTISISDPLFNIPATLATLAVSATDSSTFSGSYAITQNDINNSFVPNLATVNAQDPLTNPVNASSNNGVTLITNLPTQASMSLVKSGVFVDTNNDDFAQAGETIDYSFSITNTGNLPLSNITITDPLMPVAGSIVSLGVSSTDNSTFSGTYTLLQTDIDNGMVSNLATATATAPDSSTVNIQSNNGAPLIINLPLFSCPDF